MQKIKTLKYWEFSSVGSEHLPYKQRVGGSNPSTPTLRPKSSVHFDYHPKGRFYQTFNFQTKPFKKAFFMSCHFYILFSKNKNRFYIGATCDELKERVRKHNSNHKKGFTGMVSDWKVVYAESFETKEEAFAREREVKKWKSRKKILGLLNSKH